MALTERQIVERCAVLEHEIDTLPHGPRRDALMAEWDELFWRWQQLVILEPPV